MLSQEYKPRTKVYDFRNAGSTTWDLSDANASWVGPVGRVTRTSAGQADLSLTGSNGGWYVAELVCVDWLFRITAHTANSDTYVGLIDGEAAPASIDNHAWAKISGANRTVTVETDDDTTDASFATEIALEDDTWYRLRIDFGGDHQTIGPPGTSRALVSFGIAKYAQSLQPQKIVSNVAHSFADVAAATTLRPALFMVQGSTGTTTAEASEVEVTYRPLMGQ